MLRIDFSCFSFVTFKGSYGLFCTKIGGSKVVLLAYSQLSLFPVKCCKLNTNQTEQNRHI